MTDPVDVAGTAALTICESLLLALNDAGVLPEAEIIGVLTDAAASHRHPPANDGQAELHAAVTALIDALIAGGNSVRRIKPPHR
jgi:3-oxoacyl-(acyl-carrier-protein) synthase